MKRFLFLFILTLINLTSATAMVKEFRFRIRWVDPSDGIEKFAAGVPINIYGFNSETRTIIYQNGSSPYATGYTLGYGLYENGTCNASCDIVDVNGRVENSNANILPELPVMDYYLIVVGDHWFRLRSLGFADYLIYYNFYSGSINGTSGDYVLEGHGSWGSQTVQLGINFNGGKLNFNGSPIDLPNGYTTFTVENCTFPHTVTSDQNQETSLYSATWNHWEDNYPNRAHSFQTIGPINASSVYSLNRKLVFGIRYGNEPGSGVVNVDGNNYNTLTQTFTRGLGETLTATGVSQTVNDVSFTFSYWSDGTSNNKWYNVSETFPKQGNDQLTYYAHMVGKPLTTNRNLQMVANIGENVRLTWSSHPSSYVSHFRIYRKVKSGGTFSQAILLTTVSSTTTTYVDYEYTVTQNSNDDLLHYDVRPFFNPSSTESDPNFQAAVFGNSLWNIQSNNFSGISLTSEKPADYSTTNYPNPFNPTTTINYQIPASLNLPEGETSVFVTLKVYDILGKEVATLVNENKSAGYYKVDFDARHLSSGVYIYTINAGAFVQSKRMLLLR